METIEFQLAALDRKAKMVTYLTILLLFIVCSTLIVHLVIFLQNRTVLVPATLGATCFLLLVVLLPILWVPRKYLVDDEKVSIRRRIGDIKLPLVSINKIELADTQRLSKGTIRTMGCGGFFGYYGSFYNDSYGDLKCYLTRTKDSVVLIRCGNLNYLLSPNDADNFVQTLRQRTTKILNRDCEN